MRLTHIALLMVVMIFWGLNFVAAKYGYRDFGVNKKRVTEWVKNLSAALGS